MLRYRRFSRKVSERHPHGGLRRAHVAIAAPPPQRKEKAMGGAIRRACFVSAIAWLAMAGTATAQSSPIKIGYSMSLSGGLAGGGRQAALVYDMWAEEVNEH